MRTSYRSRLGVAALATAAVFELPAGTAWGQSAAQLGPASPLVKETVLYAFNGTFTEPDHEGAVPEGGLVFGNDGALYGTTYLDNYYGGGTVFKLTTTGTMSWLHFFCVGYNGCPDGDSPMGTLMLAGDGSFYGITPFGGGTNSFGNFFNVTTTGAVTSVYSFSNNALYFLSSMLFEGSDGNYYGTGTDSGYPAPDGGIVYKMTPGGVMTTLFTFPAVNDETGINVGGGEPAQGNIVQGTDGNFYGLTNEGGKYGLGVAYRLTPAGVETVLHEFGPISGPDGALPIGGLILASDGNFYGTTARGGPASEGTIFRLTQSGQLTILYTFSGRDGANPLASLVQAHDGNLYGTTSSGGTGGNSGTVFRITLNGRFTKLFDFDPLDAYAENATGGIPYFGPLISDGQGNLYGTTQAGGPTGGGVVYKISAGLGN